MGITIVFLLATGLLFAFFLIPAKQQKQPARDDKGDIFEEQKIKQKQESEEIVETSGSELEAGIYLHEHEPQSEIYSIYESKNCAQKELSDKNPETPDEILQTENVSAAVLLQNTIDQDTERIKIIQEQNCLFEFGLKYGFDEKSTRERVEKLYIKLCGKHTMFDDMSSAELDFIQIPLIWSLEGATQVVYQKRCWCCKKSIHTQVEERCPVCRWFICSHCGSCEPSCSREKPARITPPRPIPTDNTKSKTSGGYWLYDYQPQSISDLTKNAATPSLAEAGPPLRSEDFLKETKFLGSNSNGEPRRGSEAGYSQEYDYPIISKRRRHK